jgi:hypothetical protein
MVVTASGYRAEHIGFTGIPEDTQKGKDQSFLKVRDLLRRDDEIMVY